MRAAWIAVLTLALLTVAPVVRADEVCPGCMGGGRVGCPACAGAYGTLFIGRCAMCQGFWATMNRPRPCPRCGETGVCAQCGGKGQACWGCRGSGKVPDGTTAGLQHGTAERQTTAARDGMQALAKLAGSWTAAGDEGGQAFTSTLIWRPELGGSFLRLTETTRYADGRTARAAAMVTWDAAAQQFAMTIFLEGSKALKMSGVAAGEAIVFTAPLDGGLLRLAWTLAPDGRSIATELSRGMPGRWERISGSRAEPAKLQPELEDREPAASLAAVGFLRGDWTFALEQGGKTSRGEATYRAVVDGSWLLCREKMADAGGRVTETLGWLAFDAAAGNYVDVLHFETGRVIPLGGRAVDSTKLEFSPLDGQKLRWTWSLSPAKGRLDTVVETAGPDGAWSAVSRAAGTKR